MSSPFAPTKRCRDRRGRDADLDEPAHAESVGVEELLDALGEEHAADQQAHEHDGGRSPCRRDPDRENSHPVHDHVT